MDTIPNLSGNLLSTICTYLLPEYTLRFAQISQHNKNLMYNNEFLHYTYNNDLQLPTSEYLRYIKYSILIKNNHCCVCEQPVYSNYYTTINNCPKLYDPINKYRSVHDKKPKNASNTKTPKNPKPQKCIYCLRKRVKCMCKYYPIYHIECLDNYKVLPQTHLHTSNIKIFECPVCYFKHRIMGFGGLVVV
jgi:hypothetical protein